MPVPQFLSDLLSLLYAIASPAAMLTLVAAGLSLRTEGGMNFHSAADPSVGWGAGDSDSGKPRFEFQHLDLECRHRLSELRQFGAEQFRICGSCVHGPEATLDAAGGNNPLPSIIAAIFLLSIQATKLMFQGWNSGSYD